MQIIAIHTITDQKAFWDKAAEGTRNLPAGISLQSIMPSQDGMKAICLWDASSQDQVQGLVEDMVGDCSTNEYFPVDAVNAVGIPSATN